MRLELKPSQNPWFVVSGPNEAQVLDVSLQKEFSEGQSDRYEMDLLRYREREAHSTDRVWAIAEGECGCEIWCG